MHYYKLTLHLNLMLVNCSITTGSAQFTAQNKFLPMKASLSASRSRQAVAQKATSFSKELVCL